MIECTHCARFSLDLISIVLYNSKVEAEVQTPRGGRVLVHRACRRGLLLYLGATLAQFLNQILHLFLLSL